jgi:hypothetical protein
MKKWSLPLSALLLLTPDASQAHIKWFSAYDTTMSPLPIKDVVTATFTVVATGFCTLMFIAFIIDRLVDKTGWAKRVDAAISRCAAHAETIIRVAVGILFLILWQSGDLILLPELKTTNALVPWLQLAIAASMLFRVTLVPGAIGIMLLYAYAISEYGAFHMMDYPVIPAVAVYIGLAATRTPHLSAMRLPVLYAGIAITMMWGAIEKFAYPSWTFPLLATHHELTLGLGNEQFMYIAGFVEFSLAFFMVTGTALLRLACAALLTLLVSAIPEFGSVDAIGHLLIIAGLVAMIIAGHRCIEMPAVLVRADTLTQAGVLTSSYLATIVAAFALYYSCQFLAGR